ncbi:MAG: hypothetical protein COZ05_20650 [Armatimonadetes bacterium CG_4_10_14_3_um_filter_59_10]|nr:MAG: hypothetical protein COZ05_20650 [Armatimonadetes bacterium CG_4_10_14_3_um_filter_59_10]
MACGISTQLHHRVKELDEIISPLDEDFELNGLVAESFVRLGFLAPERYERPNRPTVQLPAQPLRPRVLLST